MIFELGREIMECIRTIYHVGVRAMFCRDYYVNSYGTTKCVKTNDRCVWYWCPKRCPKRSGGDTE